MPLFQVTNHAKNASKFYTYAQQHCYVLLKKTLTQACFEPGSSVTQADAMTTAPRRQDSNQTRPAYQSYRYLYKSNKNVLQSSTTMFKKFIAHNLL
jgi:hypothetical protein